MKETYIDFDINGCKEVDLNPNKQQRRRKKQDDYDWDDSLIEIMEDDLEPVELEPFIENFFVYSGKLNENPRKTIKKYEAGLKRKKIIRVKIKNDLEDKKTSTKEQPNLASFDKERSPKKRSKIAPIKIDETNTLKSESMFPKLVEVNNEQTNKKFCEEIQPTQGNTSKSSIENYADPIKTELKKIDTQDQKESVKLIVSDINHSINLQNEKIMILPKQKEESSKSKTIQTTTEIQTDKIKPMDKQNDIIKPLPQKVSENKEITKNDDFNQVKSFKFIQENPEKVLESSILKKSTETTTEFEDEIEETLKKSILNKNKESEVINKQKMGLNEEYKIKNEIILDERNFTEEKILEFLLNSLILKDVKDLSLINRILGVSESKITDKEYLIKKLEDLNTDLQVEKIILEEIVNINNTSDSFYQSAMKISDLKYKTIYLDIFLNDKRRIVEKTAKKITKGYIDNIIGDKIDFYKNWGVKLHYYKKKTFFDKNLHHLETFFSNSEDLFKSNLFTNSNN